MWMSRPLISASISSETLPRDAAGVRGYIIRGSRHRPGCRCRACKIVRIKARERAVKAHVFYC